MVQASKRFISQFQDALWQGYVACTGNTKASCKKYMQAKKPEQSSQYPSVNTLSKPKLHLLHLLATPAANSPKVSSNCVAQIYSVHGALQPFVMYQMRWC